MYSRCKKHVTKADDDQYTTSPVIPTAELMEQFRAGIAEWLVHKTSGIRMTAADIMAAGEITYPQYLDASGKTEETVKSLPAAVNDILMGCKDILRSPIPEFSPENYETFKVFISNSERAMLDAIRHLFSTGNMNIRELRSDLVKFLTMIVLAGYNYEDSSKDSRFLELLQSGAWSKLSTTTTGIACRPLNGGQHTILQLASESELATVSHLITAENLTAEEKTKLAASQMISITELRCQYMSDFEYYCAVMSGFEYNLIHLAYRIKELFRPCKTVGWSAKEHMECCFSYYTKGFAGLQYIPSFNANLDEDDRDGYSPEPYDDYELRFDEPNQASYDLKYPRLSKQLAKPVPESTESEMEAESSADRKRKASGSDDDTPAAKAERSDDA